MCLLTESESTAHHFVITADKGLDSRVDNLQVSLVALDNILHHGGGEVKDLLLTHKTAGEQAIVG